MKGILLVSIAFSPNLGGIETHFDDLTSVISKNKIKNSVLTYKPITSKIDAKFYEKRGSYTEIYRIPWFSGIFYKLVKSPIVEFLYLLPGLFFALPILLLYRGKEIGTIHSHGLVAGFISVFWGKVFDKKVITTTHSIYNFPNTGLYRKFSRWIFNGSDIILTLSKQSKKEIKSLDISGGKIKVFTYWIDLKRFKKISYAKEKIRMKNEFIVFCASRLIPEKGIRELLNAACVWDKRILLLISSDGPLKAEVLNFQKKYRNIRYIGRLSQQQLPLYYSASDLLIVPSTHEEGFGRVILESLACGTPVVGSNRGAIPEAIDKSVGKLIDVTPKNIKDVIEYFYMNSAKLEKLSRNARHFVERKYSEKNAQSIIKYYKK